MAYQRVGVVGVGLAPSSDQYTEGSLWLNGIVKSWNASLGMPLWSITEGVIFPINDSNSTFLGASGGHASNYQNYVHTTLSADSAISDTTIDVTSASGISDTYNIGIELDSGNMHWTTVSGAPSGTTVTLASGVATAATSGNHVYCYSTKIDRPLRILQATVYSYVSDTYIPCEIITPTEFFNLTYLATESYPTQVAYEIGHNVSNSINMGKFRYWPRFSDGTKIITIRYHRVLHDFDATGDTPDFPQEFYLPLIAELSCYIGFQYGLPTEKLAFLRREADRLLEKVSQNDYEEGSMQFIPDRASY